jgi:hypothetical protein
VRTGIIGAAFFALYETARLRPEPRAEQGGYKLRSSVLPGGLALNLKTLGVDGPVSGQDGQGKATVLETIDGATQIRPPLSGAELGVDG